MTYYISFERICLTDRANTLYKAAFLTRCYVQHFLGLYIDSEVNYKRHFYQNAFINKGMEFIDLHSIFKDNLVMSSIANYFNNSETPLICYKYSKPIRSTIFSFNKIVTDINIDSNTPYLYPSAGHVITEFAIVFIKGSKYRFSSYIDFPKCL